MQSPDGELSNPNGACVGPNSEMAGKADSCRGCPNAAICASAPKGADPDIPLIKQRLQNVKHKVLVLSGKGGVGKSTVTKELAFALGRRNLYVGVIDADICGPSLPRLTGARNEEMHPSASGWEPVSVDENVSLVSMHFLMSDRNEAVVWRGPKKNGMIKNFLKEVTWGDLDILLIDTPPGTSDEHISMVNFLKEAGEVSGAIIVTTPQEVAVSDVRREVNFCVKTKIPILGFVENMTRFRCPHCKVESIVFPSSRKPDAVARTAAEILSKDYGPPVLGSIPIDPVLMQSCEDGKSIFDDLPLELPEDAPPAAHAFTQVVDKVMTSLALVRRSADEEDQG